MADVKWIKIVTDIFDDEKIRFIETMPTGDELIVIWFRILCLCGKSNNSGFLMFTNKLPYTEEMLASIFNRDIKIIQFALNTFEHLEMIELVDDKIYVSNWEKYQNLDKLEMIREQTRKRVSKYRESKKLEHSQCGNVTVTLDVTQCNATDKDIDKDIDIEEDKEKDKETFVSVVNAYTDNSDLRQALKGYLEMRKKEKGFTVNALKLNLNKLSNLSSDINTQIEIINQSIMNTWKGFFPLKSDNQKKQSKSGNVFMDMLESGDYSD